MISEIKNRTFDYFNKKEEEKEKINQLDILRAGALYFPFIFILFPTIGGNFLLELLVGSILYFFMLGFSAFVALSLNVSFFVTFVFLNIPFLMSFYWGSPGDFLRQGDYSQCAKVLFVKLLTFTFFLVVMKGMVFLFQKWFQRN